MLVKVPVNLKNLNGENNFSLYCIFTFTGVGNFKTFVELAVFNTTITVGVAKRYLYS